MKYFRLKQEDRNGQNILIEGLINLSCFQDLKKGIIAGLEMGDQRTIETNYLDALPDFLCTQIFMFSSEVKKILELFIENVEYRHMRLVDQKKCVMKFYYIPQLPLIDCLSTKSENNQSKSHFEKVSIYHSNDYPDIFQISNVRDRIIVISLPLAESLLRRKFSGFYLEKVSIDERPLAEYLSSKENL